MMNPMTLWAGMDRSHLASLKRVLALCASLFAVQLLAFAFQGDTRGQGLDVYLPLHNSLETASIVVALVVFLVGWSSANERVDVNLIPLSCAFLAAALLDFSHMQSYRGMPDWLGHNGVDKSIHFWLSARAVTALAFLALAANRMRMGRSARHRFPTLAATLCGVLLWHVALLQWVDTDAGLFFVPGQGLTPLKTGLEVLIIGINMLTIGLLLWRMRTPQPFNVPLVLGAVMTMAMSEVFLSVYSDITDLFSLLGHVYKVISYAFAYRAFVVTTIEEPYREIQGLQRHLQGLLDAVPDPMFEVDEAGRITDYHSPRSDLLAAPPQAFIGRRYAEVIPADAAAVCQSAIEEARQQGHSNGKVYGLDLPGGRHWFELSVAHIPPTSDRLQRFILLARDISQRVRDAEQMRIAATAFDSQQGMLITNERQQILRVNKAFTQITGYEAQEVVGKTPRLFSSGRHGAEFYRTMWDAIAQSGSWRGEIWNRRKDGEEYPEWLSIASVRNAEGDITHYVAAFSDISSHKAAEQRIQALSYFDPLTGLPNRRRLLEQLRATLEDCREHGRSAALLLIDLNNFKMLNDALGHAEGDRLLQEVAQRLKGAVRDSDAVARVGGDSFAVLAAHLNPDPAAAIHQAEAVANHLRRVLGEPYRHASEDHHLGCSIGVTMLDSDPLGSLAGHLQRAELAMYRAKESGLDTPSFYAPEMQQAVSQRATVEAGLRQALQEGQFELHVQAQVLETGRLIGAEGLLRWRHPERGLVSPAEFIPVAESCGLIVPMGAWVLDKACAVLAHWARSPETAELTLAVNVSARQFRQPAFVDQVKATLARTGARPERLKLELTESSLVDDIEEVIATMNALKATGIGFALDDFGTGYSSLSYLKRLPLDQLKIDQSFVRHVLTDPDDAAIARMVIVLGQTLGLSVLAEGVETYGQQQFLAGMGCHTYQGYLFGKPMAVADFEAQVLAP